MDVQFEPGVKKFDFGSVELAQLPLPRGRKDDSNGGWGEEMFFSKRVWFFKCLFIYF